MQATNNNNNNRVQAPIQLGQSLVEAPITLNLSGVPTGPQLDARPHTGDRKWKVMSSTPGFRQESKLSIKSRNDAAENAGRMEVLLKSDPLLQGKEWEIGFSGCIYYTDTNGDEVSVPFSKLSFGENEPDAIAKKKEQFLALFKESRRLVLGEGRDISFDVKDYSSSFQDSHDASSDLHKMTVLESKDSKGVLSQSINTKSLDSLSIKTQNATKKNSGETDNQFSTRKATEETERKKRLKQLKDFHSAFVKKVETLPDKDKSVFRALKSKLDSCDIYAASAAIIAQPTAKEIEEEKMGLDEFLTEKELEQKAKDQVMGLAADNLKKHLVEELVQAKNNQGVYDSRGNFAKLLPSFRLRTHFIPGDEKNSSTLKFHITQPYGLDELAKDEEDYIERVVRLVKEDRPESLEWQLMQKAKNPEYQIQWTKVLGRPLTRDELVDLKKNVEGIDDYEAEYVDASLAPAPTQPSLIRQAAGAVASAATSAATSLASTVTNTVSNIASAAQKILPSGEGSRFDIYDDQ